MGATMKQAQLCTLSPYVVKGCLEKASLACTLLLCPGLHLSLLPPDLGKLFCLNSLQASGGLQCIETTIIPTELDDFRAAQRNMA